MDHDEEEASRQNKVLQPPLRRTVKTNEASISAGAVAETNWRSLRSMSGQHVRRQSEFFGDQHKGRRGPYDINRNQHSNWELWQRRPHSNNYGSRRPSNSPSPFSELLLDVQHEDSNKVIISIIICFKWPYLNALRVFALALIVS
jgi:hypothetical protein